MGRAVGPSAALTSPRGDGHLLRRMCPVCDPPLVEWSFLSPPLNLQHSNLPLCLPLPVPSPIEVYRPARYHGPNRQGRQEISFHPNRNGGALDVGPPCRMSNLRNCNVPCPYFCNIHADFKIVSCRMLN